MYLLLISGSNNSTIDLNPQKEKPEESYFGPKPMLPYSSMFVFSPTNP